jgi:hypothetical protein
VELPGYPLVRSGTRTVVELQRLTIPAKYELLMGSVTRINKRESSMTCRASGHVELHAFTS